MKGATEDREVHILHDHRHNDNILPAHKVGRHRNNNSGANSSMMDTKMITAMAETMVLVEEQDTMTTTRATGHKTIWDMAVAHRRATILLRKTIMDLDQAAPEEDDRHRRVVAHCRDHLPMAHIPLEVDHHQGKGEEDFLAQDVEADLVHPSDPLVPIQVSMVFREGIDDGRNF